MTYWNCGKIGHKTRECTKEKKTLEKKGSNHIYDWGKDPSSFHGANPWPLFKQLVHGQLL
jgi:hypothetical protein